MRKIRVLRLVVAATLLVAAGALAFVPYESTVPTVDWVSADETNPVYPPESPEPGVPGDGTPGADGEDGGSGDGDGDGDGEDGGSGPDGGGDSGDSEVNGPGGSRDGASSGGMLGLSFPAQAGVSVGLVGLAFLALLPGRRMPEHLR